MPKLIIFSRPSNRYRSRHQRPPFGDHQQVQPAPVRQLIGGVSRGFGSSYSDFGGDIEQVTHILSYPY